MSLRWIVAGSTLIGIAVIVALSFDTLVTSQVDRAFGLAMEQMPEERDW